MKRFRADDVTIFHICTTYDGTVAGGGGGGRFRTFGVQSAMIIDSWVRERPRSGTPDVHAIIALPVRAERTPKAERARHTLATLATSTHSLSRSAQHGSAGYVFCSAVLMAVCFRFVGELRRCGSPEKNGQTSNRLPLLQLLEGCHIVSWTDVKVIGENPPFIAVGTITITTDACTAVGSSKVTT